MYTHALTTLILLSGLVAAFPTASITPRQASACFITGKETLPKEVADSVTSIQDAVTCSSTVKTLSNVPDTTSGIVSFSQIDFSKSDQTPLEFALETFATADPVADTDLKVFQAGLDVYLATEAGIRSVKGNFGPIKAPKFFLEMQVSRIQTAQGNPPTAPGLQVDHLKDKILTNALGEDQALLDQVTAIAKILA
jgi:hypothetical protein